MRFQTPWDSPVRETSRSTHCSPPLVHGLINALRELDGRDCVRLSTGRLRLFLYEKGKQEPREVELSLDVSRALQVYVEAFNQCATQSGWQARMRLGEPGPIWRQPRGDYWQYRDIVATLRTGCASADTPDFTPHELRRAFASDTASGLPRHTVAQAGGWKGVECLDNHYIQPREPSIWSKLHRITRQQAMPDITEVDIHAAVLAV
jgi:integrase